MSSDPPPNVHALSAHVGELRRDIAEIKTDVKALLATHHQQKGQVRAYSAVVSVLVSLGVSLLVAVIAKALG